MKLFSWATTALPPRNRKANSTPENPSLLGNGASENPHALLKPFPCVTAALPPRNVKADAPLEILPSVTKTLRPLAFAARHRTETYLRTHGSRAFSPPPPTPTQMTSDSTRTRAGCRTGSIRPRRIAGSHRSRPSTSVRTRVVELAGPHG